MATEILELITMVRGAQAAANELKTIGAAANGVKDILGFMRNALVALSFLRAAEGAIQMLNAYQLAQNQLKLVTNNIQEATVAQSVLTDLAIKTRAPYVETVNTFAQLARTTTSLNLTYRQIIDL